MKKVSEIMVGWCLTFDAVYRSIDFNDSFEIKICKKIKVKCHDRVVFETGTLSQTVKASFNHAKWEWFMSVLCSLPN